MSLCAEANLPSDHLFGQVTFTSLLGPSRIHNLSAPEDGHVIVAYYFYTTLRCENCLQIEAWAKEALDSAFAEQQAAGLLWWRPLNTDLNPYAHFAMDYNLDRKSLVIAEFQDGERVRWKKCERVWDLLQDKPGFAAYVQAEVDEYLSP